MLLVTISLLEVSLRMLGYHTFKEYEVQMKNILPESCMIPDSNIGFSLKPGEYTFNYVSGYSFKTHHDKNGYRKSPSTKDSIQKQINFYGGSLFYGIGLEDSSVFTHILSQKIKNYNINNCAIFGHNMVTPLVQIKEQIKRGKKPDIAIVTYASYNLSRNVYSVESRRAISGHNGLANKRNLQYLFTRFDKKDVLKKQMGKFEYSPFTLSRHSVLSNKIEEIYAEYEHKSYNPELVEKLLIDEYVQLCKSNNIQLIVALVTNNNRTDSMIDYLKSKGVNTLNLHVDYSDNRYNLLPFDNHPNELAHEIYAEKTYNYLKEQSLLTDPN